MKILAIGNSFSQDAFAYLHDMAESSGFDVTTLNLYIGGCSLEEHEYNIFFNKPYYDFELNGHKLNSEQDTIHSALISEDWDYISLQQLSGESGIIESYYPHIRRIIAGIKMVRPDAKILIHETWAYDKGSHNVGFANYNNDQSLMHKKLKECYSKVALDIGAYKIIPTGDVIASLRCLPCFNMDIGRESLCRDTYHLSHTYGRYAAAATWFQSLCMGDIMENTFIPPADNIDKDKIELIKKTVKEVCNKA